MRIAALVLGVVGSLALFALGVVWAGQYQDLEKSDLYQLLQDARRQGQSNPEMEANMVQVERLGTAGYWAAGLSLLAFLGSFLALKWPRVAGGVMALAVVVPAVLAPRTLVFSSLLLVAAALALLAKPKPRRIAAAS